MKSTSLRHAGLILIFTAVLAKCIGFLREAVIAATYGTSQTVDLYLSAATIPALAATVLYHSIPNAFVPLYSVGTPGQRARKAAWVVLAIMLLVTLAMWFFAEYLVYLTGAGFSAAVRGEAATLFRVSSVAVALATVEALSRSRLLARKQFLQPGLSSMWQSIAMIVAVVMSPTDGARTLTWGFVAGNAASAIWNLVPFRRSVAETGKDSTLPLARPQSDGLGIWIALVLLVDTIPQFYALIDRQFGSFLPAGSIAALQYANLVAILPQSIFSVAVGMAIFPYLSESIQSGDHARAGDILDRAFRWSMIAVVPLAVLLMVFNSDIIRLLYERGVFNAESRRMTASILFLYSLSIVPNVFMAVAAKVFYSSRRWGPILLAAVASVAIKYLLSLIWRESYGVQGIAAATTVGSVIGAAILFLALPHWVTVGKLRGWGRYIVVPGSLVLAGSLPGWFVMSHVPGAETITAAVARVVLGVLIGGLLLVLAGPRLGIPELAQLRLGAIKRLDR